MALHLVSTTQLHHHPPAPTPQIITPQRTSNWLLAAAKLRPSFWPRWVHLVLPAQHDKASWPHGSLLQKRVAGAFLAALCSGASLHPDSFVILGSGFKKRELDVSFIGGGVGLLFQGICPAEGFSMVTESFPLHKNPQSNELTVLKQWSGQALEAIRLRL